MTTIPSIMPIKTLTFDTFPECVVVVPPFGGFVGGPKNVTETILFEPTGQKMHILPMDFNTSEVATISLILHRCAGVTILMVSCTCRLCILDNDLNIQ